MIKPLQQNFKDAINFSNDLVTETQNNFQDLLTFLSDFKEIYDKEEKKMPYHINLIDELRANENAHSRILMKLLQKREVISDKYEILESFFRFIIEKYNKNDFKIKIENPIITHDIKHIDLWIRDNNYAIIIENKVHNAIDQTNDRKGGQLERYINFTKTEEFKEEQIYVLYLPPTYEKKPDEQTWGEYYETDIYNNRYLNLSFKDDILPWLKNMVLPNIRLKDKYLSSAIEQYIDHLEGKFSLRTINNNMNMELQKFIKEKLGLNGIEPEAAMQKVVNKKKALDDAINQLTEIEKQIEIEHFVKWEKLLSKDFPNYKVVGDTTGSNDEGVDIGVAINLKDGTSFILTILFEYYKNIYYGIIPNYKNESEKIETLDLQSITSDLDLKVVPGWWYVKGNTSFTNAYNDLTTLIKKVEQQYKNEIV